MQVIGIYDNPAFFDRYTIAFDTLEWDPTSHRCYHLALALSHNPGSGQGVSLWTVCDPTQEQHAITWQALPHQVQTHVVQRLEDDQEALESIAALERRSRCTDAPTAPAERGSPAKAGAKSC